MIFFEKPSFHWDKMKEYAMGTQEKKWGPAIRRDPNSHLTDN